MKIQRVTGSSVALIWVVGLEEIIMLAKLIRSRVDRAIGCSNGKNYSSQQEASRMLKLPAGNINKVLKGTYKSCGGLTFWYIKD